MKKLLFVLCIFWGSVSIASRIGDEWHEFLRGEECPFKEKTSYYQKVFKENSLKAKPGKTKELRDFYTQLLEKELDKFASMSGHGDFVYLRGIYWRYLKFSPEESKKYKLNDSGMLDDDLSMDEAIRTVIARESTCRNMVEIVSLYKRLIKKYPNNELIRTRLASYLFIGEDTYYDILGNLCEGEDCVPMAIGDLEIFSQIKGEDKYYVLIDILRNRRLIDNWFLDVKEVDVSRYSFFTILNNLLDVALNEKVSAKTLSLICSSRFYYCNGDWRALSPDYRLFDRYLRLEKGNLIYKRYITFLEKLMVVNDNLEQRFKELLVVTKRADVMDDSKMFLNAKTALKTLSENVDLEKTEKIVLFLPKEEIARVFFEYVAGLSSYDPFFSFNSEDCLKGFLLEYATTWNGYGKLMDFLKTEVPNKFAIQDELKMLGNMVYALNKQQFLDASLIFIDKAPKEYSNSIVFHIIENVAKQGGYEELLLEIMDKLVQRQSLKESDSKTPNYSLYSRKETFVHHWLTRLSKENDSSTFRTVLNHIYNMDATKLDSQIILNLKQIAFVQFRISKRKDIFYSFAYEYEKAKPDKKITDGINLYDIKTDLFVRLWDEEGGQLHPFMLRGISLADFEDFDHCSNFDYSSELDHNQDKGNKKPTNTILLWMELITRQKLKTDVLVAELKSLPKTFGAQYFLTLLEAENKNDVYQFLDGYLNEFKKLDVTKQQKFKKGFEKIINNPKLFSSEDQVSGSFYDYLKTIKGSELPK